MLNIIKYLKENILLLPFLLWSLLPALAYNNIARGVVLISVLLMVVLDKSKHGRTLLFSIIGFILYTFFINYYFSDKNFILRHLQLHIFLFSIYISWGVLFYKPKRKEQIIFIILILNLITSFLSISALLLNRNVSRLIAKSSELAIEASSLGIGGYGSVYLNILFVPLFYYLYKTTSNKKIKLLALINLIISFIFIFLSSYFIALLILFVQIFYLFYLNNNKSGNLTKIAVFGLAIAFFLINVDYFEQLTFQWVENSNLRYKHNDIFNMIKGTNSQVDYGTVDGRSERYSRSFFIFLNSPLAGVFRFDDLGKHSNILDVFAQYGLVVGIVLIKLILYIPKKIYSFVTANNIKMIYAFVFSVLLLGLLNNYPLQAGVSFIFLTAIIDIDKNKNEKRQS